MILTQMIVNTLSVIFAFHEFIILWEGLDPMVAGFGPRAVFDTPGLNPPQTQGKP